MKKKCKNVNIRNIETIRPWAMDCCSRHYKRHDFKRLFLEHGMTADQYTMMLIGQDKFFINFCIDNICRDAIERIENRSLNLPKVHIRTRIDTTTGKVRQIGEESAMQQIFDYIAVYGAMDIFKARMVEQQASSIPKRGQIYGTQMIKHWIVEDNRAIDYASKHGYNYSPKCKYFVKLDIQKCYPTASTDVFLKLFEHDCGNDDLVWLWSELMNSHHVDGYDGFMIGALVSQWACQFMMSFIYRYAKEQNFMMKRNHKINTVTHMCMFMDDMLLFASNRKRLKKAVERTTKYVEEAFGWHIKDGWQIRELEKFPIDMMGFYVHRNGKITIRDYDFLRARRLCLRITSKNNISESQARRILSYKGFFDYSDTKKVAEELKLKEIIEKSKAIVSMADRRKNNERIKQNQTEQD